MLVIVLAKSGLKRSNNQCRRSHAERCLNFWVLKNNIHSIPIFFRVTFQFHIDSRDFLEGKNNYGPGPHARPPRAPCEILPPHVQYSKQLQPLITLYVPWYQTRRQPSPVHVYTSGCSQIRAGTRLQISLDLVIFDWIRQGVLANLC